MGRTTDISLTVDRYSRTDFTALRALLSRVPIPIIYNRYYFDYDREVLGLNNSGDLRERLEAMRDMLIARAGDKNRNLVQMLGEARARNFWTPKVIDELVHAADRDSSMPLASDPVTLWFKLRMAARINEEGCRTLEDLANMINARGSRWYLPIPFFGVGCAQVIVSWFRSHKNLAELIDEDRLLPTRPAYEVIEIDEFSGQMAPFDRMKLATHIDGHNGLYRRPGPAFIRARNDYEAALAYLTTFANRSKTLRAYEKEISRFILFCVMYLQKPMSSADVDDCNAYVEFLKHPPKSWCSPKRAARNTTTWRPFVGPLSDTSQVYAVTVLRAFYAYLHKVGYLIGTPWASSTTPEYDQPELPMQIERALPATLWGKLTDPGGILDWLCSLPEDAICTHIKPGGTMKKTGVLPQMRMLRAAVTLMGETGIRRAEAATATRDKLEPAEEHSGLWVLRILGKGRKRRRVPVPVHVVEALTAHWDDRGLDFSDRESTIALLGPVNFPRTTRSTDKHGEQATDRFDKPFSIDSLGRAVANGLKSIANDTANPYLTEGDRAVLLETSSHALRHTFATLAVADELPQDVLRTVLGHESLETTSIYVDTEHKRMLKETAIRNAKRKRTPLTTADETAQQAVGAE